MEDVRGPEVEEHNGVVEVKYNSDGVLAVEEGTEYSRESGQYDLSESDQLLTVEAGESVYIEVGSDFAAYDIEEFAKTLAKGQTEVFDPERTKVWDPATSTADTDTTSIFDPSKYDIEDPTEYVSMMKENADTIILELADKGVTGKEATETLDQLFDSMNDTYDRFVASQTSPAEDTGIHDDEGSAQHKTEKRRLTDKEAKEHLEEVEEELSGDETTLDDYVDAEELLDENKPPAQGQSEISDW